jgi:hypothetical protein
LPFGILASLDDGAAVYMTRYTILILILIIAGVAATWLFSREDWTLMVCKEKLNAAECYSTSYVISGFKGQKECMLEGASRFSREGFECGKNCKKRAELQVCKEICNSAGCSQ